MGKNKRSSDENLFSITGAATALNRSRRTVAKALLTVKPAEIRSGLKLWRMSDIVSAVNRNTQAPITPQDGSNAPNHPHTVSFDLARSRAALAEAQTRKATVEVGILSGQYWKAETVIKEREAELFVMRERLLTIPGKVADKLTPYTPQDRGAIELILRDVLYEAMEDIASPDFMTEAMERRGKRRGYEPYPPVETKKEPAE